MSSKLLSCTVAGVLLLAAGCNKSTTKEDDNKQGIAGGETRETANQPDSRPAPTASLVLPAGTPIRARLISSVSTSTHKPGDTFDATLAEPLVAGSRTIAQKGASVTGRVVQSDPGGRVKGVASIAVQLTGLETEDGRKLKISTGTVARVARTSKRSDATKIGIGAGIGAAVGAIAGGAKGAAIGAAAGGGAGTGAVLATRGKPAVIASETVLHFKLLNAVTVKD